MSSKGFDHELKLVSSYAFKPSLLAAIRLLFAVFTLATLIFFIIHQSVVRHKAESFLSYFTNLTFIGLCAYFFASGVQTFFYFRNARSGNHEYPLQRWARPLQFLHTVLTATVITFPFLVTIVYWILLASPHSFESRLATFSNVTKHALNSAFALFEILLTNVGPMPWIHLPITVLLLLGYLGVAYITRATQGFYTYSFLDPQKQGKRLGAYFAGIAIGQIVIFLIVRGIIVLRTRLTRKKNPRRAEFLSETKSVDRVRAFV